MAFYNKGALTQDLPGQGTLCFLNGSGVQVPVMTQSFGSMAVVVEGTFAGEKRFLFQVPLEFRVLSSTHASAI